ncbi:MAG: TetR family transcriptional regulator [Hyphomonadaceae bacterium]
MMAAERETTARRRNAEATRAAILKSARAAFVKSGYDGAGVREIAAGAGVTAMMVNRYFGSKEKLFAEVVAQTMAEPTILTRENLSAPDVARTLARGMVEVTGRAAATLDGFQIMQKSGASARAAEIGRAQIEKQHFRTLADALTGEHVAERAGLILSIAAGLQQMRQGVGLRSLTRADPEVLVALLTPVLQALLEDNSERKQGGRRRGM